MMKKSLWGIIADTPRTQPEPSKLFKDMIIIFFTTNLNLLIITTHSANTVHYTQMTFQRLYTKSLIKCNNIVSMDSNNLKTSLRTLAICHLHPKA